MTDYHQTAALALAKCAAYDPWFPQPNRATVESWAEQIEQDIRIMRSADEKLRQYPKAP